MNRNQAPPFITRSHIFAFVFFAIFLFLLYQMASMLAPFSSALLWAAILCLALNPVYVRTLALVRGRVGFAALIMTSITVLLIVGPAIALLSVATSQAVDLYQWTSGGIQSGKFIESWDRVSAFLNSKVLTHPALSGIDIKGLMLKSIGDVSSNLVSQIGSLMKNILFLAVNLAVMLIALFFLFRDGESYYRSVMNMLPFSPENRQSISRKVHDTFTAVIKGVFFIALMQGMMTGIGFALFGVPFSVFWGFLASILALLPIGGAALVWIPGALYLYLTGSTLHGIFLAAWGTLLVSLPDNFFKPVLIGRKAKLPSFFLFIGILGGLKVYGFLGILFGPLVVTLLIAFVQIYREEFAEDQKTSQ